MLNGVEQPVPAVVTPESVIAVGSPPVENSLSPVLGKLETLLNKKTEWVRGKIEKNTNTGEKTLNTDTKNPDTYFYPIENQNGKEAPNLRFGIQQTLNKENKPTTIFSFSIFRAPDNLIGGTKSRVFSSEVNIDVTTLRKDEKGNWIKPQQKNSRPVHTEDWKIIKTYLDKMGDFPGFTDSLDESVKKTISKPDEIKSESTREILDELAKENKTADADSETEKVNNVVEKKSGEITKDKEVILESGHKYPFIEDSPDNISGRVSFEEIKKASEKAKKNESPKVTALRENIKKINTFLKDKEVKKELDILIPRKQGESDKDYRTRTLELLVNNQNGRLVFLGDNERKNDPISTLLINKGFRSEVETPRLLQAAEGLYYMELDAQNKAKSALYEQAASEGKFDIATYVEEARGIVDIGGSSSIYEQTPEKRVRKEMATRDNHAAMLLTNGLSSLTYEVSFDLSTGEKRSLTFNEKMEPLLERRKQASTPEEKALISRQIDGEYKRFLNRTLEAMRKREKAINPFSRTDPSEIFESQAYSLFQELKNSPQQAIETLISRYQENPSFKRMSEAVKTNTFNKIRATFEKPEAKADFLGYAQKGVEFLERRMELLRIPKPELSEIPSELYAKKWKQDGEYHRFNKIGEPVEEVSAVVVSPVPEKEGEKPEVAPVVDIKTKESDDGKNPENPDSAPITPKPIPPPELATGFSVAAVMDNSHIEQVIATDAQHVLSQDKPARGFFAGIFTPITHPREFVRNVVQNTLFKGTFEARARSYSRSMMEVARKKHAGLDSSIPFERLQDILDKSITEGRQVRKKDNVFKRIGYTFYDVGSGLTGLYQNSDHIYARKWFEENGKPLVDQVKKVSLSEQTQLGEKFALDGKDEDIISKDLGETRYRLEELISDEKVRNGFQGKIKELIGKYAQKQLNDEELLKEFNLYYHKEVFPKIPDDKQIELEGIEISSNILRLGHNMLIEDTMTTGEKKTRYQRYQDETTEDGKKKWDELELRIYVGQGKYETARGEVRLSGLEKKLIHRMVERDYKLSNGLVLNSAVETLKDIGIYGGAYLAGGGGAVLMAGRSAFNVGGLIVTPIVAGAREGVLFSRKGKLYGIRGKAVTDFEQVSRETAQGRASMDKARLRPMFEKALVDQRSANELTSPITSLLAKESLSVDEQKKLMMEITHAKARLHLSDQSTIKGKEFLNMGQISVAQNFVGYSEGKQNQEMTALRAAIVQGVGKLSQSNPQLYGKMQQAQAVYEAQLKIGSVQNKMDRVVSVDTGLSLSDAHNIVTEFYQDLGIDTTAGKSLEKAAFTLAKVVDRRAATTAAFAFVVSPIIGTELHAIGELGNIGEHLLSSHNLTGWLADWGQVGNRNIPLTYDGNHNLVSGLSSLQKDVLTVENLIQPPPGFAHSEVIDGVSVTLPGGVEHGYISGHPDEDALVNIRTGEVLVHMDHSHLSYQDLNGDGKLEIAVINERTGQSVDAVNAFGQFKGVTLIQDPSLDKVTSSNQEVFHPGTTVNQGVDLDHNGTVDVTTKIPANTNWQFDNANGKWDLHGTNINGSDRILIHDATINPNGQITGGTYDHTFVTINNGSLVPGKVGPEVNVGPTSGGEVWHSAADYRVVSARTEPQAINDFVEKTGDPAHPYAVTFVWHDKNITNPDNGTNINVSDAYQKGEVAMFLQVPGLGAHGQDLGIVIKGAAVHRTADGTGYQVNFDPTDTKTMISPSMTMAALARDLLNTENLNKYVDQHGTGSLGSELTYEGRAAFNLANPDGLLEHQGIILAGVLAPTGNNLGHNGGLLYFTHVVHGSGLVNSIESPPPTPPTPNYEPIIDIGNISETINTTNPGYRVDVVPHGIPWLPIIGVPMREPIERSVHREGSAPVTTTQNNIPTTQPTVPVNKSRDELEEIAVLESSLNPPIKERELTDEEKQRFEKMTEQAKKVLNSTAKSGKKYSEEVYEQLTAEIKKDPDNKSTDDQIREYLDRSLEASLINDRDVAGPKRDENKAGYTEDLDTAIQYLKSVCVSRGITSAEQLKEFYLDRLSQKTKEQLAEKDPTKKNPALHRMASLAAVMKLTDEGELVFEMPAAKINIPETEVHFNEYYKKFLELDKAGEVEAGSFYPTGEGKFIWQEVTYGQERQKSGDNCYRGYLMIEPTDFPKALDILKTIGNKRKGEGKRLDFKWLLMTTPTGLTADANKWVEYIKDEKNFSKYGELKLTDPRIVIYGDDASEVQEILSTLAENPNWEEIEKNRVDAAGGKPENAPRRAGTNAFSLHGKELRSLNWNDKPGYSEDEAADPNWRNEKIGDKTILAN